MPRLPSPSYLAAMLPALLLAACGDSTPPAEPPLPPGALEAVAEQPGANRERLARAVDALFTRDDIGETRAVIVMHAAEPAADRYTYGYGPEPRVPGWSMTNT